MIFKILRLIFFNLVFISQSFLILAQDRRTQYPRFLINSYININIGYIDYPFSNLHLQPGYHAQSISIPHVGVRIILLGHSFNKYLSAQISYMRPVLWVHYKNVNGDQSNHSVFMNVAGLTLKSSLPIKEKFSIYGEAGLGIITRSGFSIDDAPVFKDANYATLLFGTGLQYHLNKKWDLIVSTAYSPANSKVDQPYTIFYSMGFTYKMQPLSDQRVERNSNTHYIFPRNLIQVGYSTNTFGYGVNNFVSERAIPIFWGGNADIEQGVSVHYQRNIFHSRKVFSLDWGTSISYWESKKNKNEFFTFSVFPLFRFTIFRLKPADLYFNYSVAGPTFISKTNIDNYNTGKHFTFQDFMGMGFFAGKNRHLNAEIRIAHYSNGNLFPQNNGVKIPLTFNLGYAF